MRPFRLRSGLTIVDVIVIIVVLAILLGLLMPAIHGPSGPGKMAEAASNLTQFTYAVRQFYTDYGYYPIDPKLHWKGDAVYGFPGSIRHNSDVINVLRADGTDPGPNYGNALNPNQTVYLDVPEVKDPANPKSGLGTGKETNSYGVTVAGEWYDPWGSPYILFIDASHKGVFDMGRFYSDLTNPHTDVVGVSFGADKEIGTKGDRKYAGSDDVIAGSGQKGWP